MMKTFFRKASLIFLISLFFLSACGQNIPPESIAPSASPTQTPSPTLMPATATPSHTPTVTNTATPSPTPTATPQPEIDPAEFDYAMLDIMQWEGELKVSNVEKLPPGRVVEVREGYHTVLYSTPLFDDFKENRPYYYDGIRITDIPEGFKFELLETRKISSEDGKSIVMGTVRNAGDVSTLAPVSSIILSAENEEGEIINFTQESEDVIATASLVDFDFNRHMNDQQIVSIFLRNILQYQKEHGPFVAGQTYSIREVANIDTEEVLDLFHYYLDSYTLDQAAGTLVNLLTRLTKVATRDPVKVDRKEVPSFVGLGANTFDREYYGVHFTKEPSSPDKPTNDVILTFKESSTGATSYYIDGDIINRDCGYHLAFYLKEELSEEDLEESLMQAEDVYQELLERERTGIYNRYWEAEGVQTYIYLEASKYENGEAKLDDVIEKIHPLINSDEFFVEKWQ